MKTTWGLGCGFGIAALIAITSIGSANNKHFKNANDGKACGSMITQDLIEACTTLQLTKNSVCNRATECLPDKQEARGKEFSDLQRWWDSEGKNAPDNDYKADRKRRMNELWQLMDDQKKAAIAGKQIAQECVVARDNVQKFYENRGIPGAEAVKNDLLSQRRTLVDRFNDTKTKRENAKSKYEASGSKDDGLKREWESARDDNIKAGQELDDFDRKYGPDIQYWFDRLVSYYQTEKTNHDPVSKQAEARKANCERSENVSFPSSKPF